MAPEERMWKPMVAMPEQCNYCRMYFHEDIGGICSPCYQLMRGSEERSGVEALQEDLRSDFPAGIPAEEEE